MSKRLKINMGDYLSNIASNIIRDKEDIILLQLEIIKALLIGDIISDEDKKGQVIIYINKMSRIFIDTEDKKISFNFPFNIEVKDEYLRIYDSETGIVIDNAIVSILISFVKRKTIYNYTLDKLYDELSENESTQYGVDTIWAILKKLILCENGYIRYDYDTEYENGDYHPLHHFDVSYSSNSAFKIGLYNTINIDDFIDILDIQSECSYIHKRVK